MLAQTLLIEKYGEPDDTYQQKYCVIWVIDTDFPWFPAKKIFINKDFKDKLIIALKAIENGGFKDEIITFDGCYSYRKSRTTNKLSLHSWAAAVDLNATTEKLKQTTTNWSEGFLKCMTDAGIFWGGNFTKTRDPMHFALYNG